MANAEVPVLSGHPTKHRRISWKARRVRDLWGKASALDRSGALVGTYRPLSDCDHLLSPRTIRHVVRRCYSPTMVSHLRRCWAYHRTRNPSALWNIRSSDWSST